MRHRFVLNIAAALVLSLAAGGVLAAAQGPGGGNNNEPPPPPPRNAEGRVLLHADGPDGSPGLWQGAFGGLGTLGSNAWPLESVPLQPWALALYQDRQPHELEPHARCQISGVIRQFQTPYGMEIVEFPELQQVYLFDVGGPHTWRTVYMDGRSHPEYYRPNGYGHSIGWWEGDTLVVDTIGFSEGFWLDRRGIPHTEGMHTLERFTRTSLNTIVYEVTIDDPNTFTEPWGGSFNIQRTNNIELFEYICQQANYGAELMIGSFESVDRSSPIVP